jgi:hypothetical protein
MAQEAADRREIYAVPIKVLRKGVPEIMDPKVPYAGLLARRRKRPPKAKDPLPFLGIAQDILRDAREAPQDLEHILGEDK